jgi:hypothetical protein
MATANQFGGGPVHRHRPDRSSSTTPIDSSKDCFKFCIDLTVLNGSNGGFFNCRGLNENYRSAKSEHAHDLLESNTMTDPITKWRSHEPIATCQP